MDFADALEEFVRQRKGKGLVVAQVTSTDTVNMTFDCVDAEGNEYLDVRTNAIPGKAGVWVVPSPEATVMICDLGNLEQDYVLIQAGGVDGFYVFVSEGTEVYVNDQEIRLGSGDVEPAVLGNELNSTLFDLIQELVDGAGFIRSFATTQAAASQGTLAPLAPGFSQLAADMAVLRSRLSNVQANLANHLSDVVKIAP
jgi:hypothetical protein